MYPREETEEEVIQEVEGELSLSRMEDEIQEDMMEDSDDEGGTFLDLTGAIDHEGTNTTQEVGCVCICHTV